MATVVPRNQTVMAKYIVPVLCFYSQWNTLHMGQLYVQQTIVVSGSQTFIGFVISFSLWNKKTSQSL